MKLLRGNFKVKETLSVLAILYFWIKAPSMNKWLPFTLLLLISLTARSQTAKPGYSIDRSRLLIKETNRAARELPLTLRSSHAPSWVTRALAALHFLSACWIAGLFASTMLVTSLNEMRARCASDPASPDSARLIEIRDR